jgi:hypothetical protein
VSNERQLVEQIAEVIAPEDYAVGNWTLKENLDKGERTLTVVAVKTLDANQTVLALPKAEG